MNEEWIERLTKFLYGTEWEGLFFFLFFFFNNYGRIILWSGLYRVCYVAFLHHPFVFYILYLVMKCENTLGCFYFFFFKRFALLSDFVEYFIRTIKFGLCFDGTDI